MSPLGVRLSILEARVLLGVGPVADRDALAAAFRAAAKLAHPDRPGGDAARFRQMVLAYRTLQAAEPPALPYAPREVVARITPLVALRGGEVDIFPPDGRRLRARLPRGARHGEALRVGGWRAVVEIVGEAHIEVRGSDVWATAWTQPFVLQTGGRALVETPLGLCTLWVSREEALQGVVRVEGQGLPARGAHPQGDLILRLERSLAETEGAARAHLRRFTAAWAA